VKLLHSNDSRGIHAPSWYQASCPIDDRDTLSRHVTKDICVIGAGFTGLSAGLHLGESGKSVAILDAHRVGWGASGRNGGQLGSGFNQNQLELEQLIGKSKASQLWAIAEDAKQLIHTLCEKHEFSIDYVPGIVTAYHKARYLPSAHDYCKYIQREYGYEQFVPLNKHALQKHVKSEDYFGGVIDHGAGHIHPLKLASGLANAAEQAGVQIFERSEVIRISSKANSDGYRVITPQGSILCDQIVLATNGYIDDLQPVVNRWIMPINNFIGVTEPLGNLAKELLPANDAVADSRFVVNYFRRVENDRILFGGGENYSYRFPTVIEKLVRKAMKGVFPSLADVRLDYTWGGTLAITRSRLPYAALVDKGVYAAGGYSGHGVALAALYGQAIAQHILGDVDRFDILQSLPNKPFPGGKPFRSALLASAMTGYSWVDKI